MSDPTTALKKKTEFFRPWQIIRYIPFTLCMVILLLLVAWWTHSYFHELAKMWVSQLGFAPRDFWLFRWERLILSALVTNGAVSFGLLSGWLPSPVGWSNGFQVAGEPRPPSGESTW
jgi:hypothetical protein